MKWKKYAAAALATMMIAGNAMAVTASASARDSDFAINISTSGKSQNLASRRQKEDSSYTYVNYSTKLNGSSAYAPAKFRAYVYGSNGSKGTLVDCSSYTSSGAARKPAIVTLGTRGFITQLFVKNMELTLMLSSTVPTTPELDTQMAAGVLTAYRIHLRFTTTNLFIEDGTAAVTLLFRLYPTQEEIINEEKTYIICDSLPPPWNLRRLFVHRG